MNLNVDAFLDEFGEKLNLANDEQRADAYAGAAAWTVFVFRALAESASRFEMTSCASRYKKKEFTRGSYSLSKIEEWAKREYLFDVTWFRSECGDWDTPALILEHENLWDEGAFMYDFWKLLIGYAPLRVMIGYSRHKEDHDSWIGKVNDALSSESIRLPDAGVVNDVILLGHGQMAPTGYAVYRREGRRFEKAGELGERLAGARR